MKSKSVYLILVLYLIGVWAVCWFFIDAAFWTTGLVLTACGVTIAVVYVMISRLSAAQKPASPQAASEPQSVRPARDAASELPSDVRALMTEAQSRLERSPTLASRGLKAKLHDLPLYLLIGPEGSGKTSTFLQSGLEPELLAGQAMRDGGVAPTRLCNLWFVRNSLVADVSGAAMQQGGPIWDGLLEALRPKGESWLQGVFKGGSSAQSNLRGVIVFYSASDFSGVPDTFRLTTAAKQVQEKLRQIGELFRADFPAYLVFAKSDGLPYFREFCSRFTQEEVLQPLGCPLPPLSREPSGSVYAEEQTQRISQSFNQLFYGLADWRTTLLAREPDATKKPAIYEFPREVKRVRGAVTQFIVDAFRPVSLQPGAVLRGFFFGGTRAVASGAVSRNFSDSEPTRMFRAGDLDADLRKLGSGSPRAASAEPTAPAWIFTPQLFTGILSQRGNPSVVYQDGKADFIRRIAFGAITALSILLLILVARSWWNNRQLLETARERSAALSASLPRLERPRTADLAQLDNERDTLVEMEKYAKHVPWRLGFALYQGDNLLPGVRKFYFAKFRERLLDGALTVMNGALQGLPVQPDESHTYAATYNQLKGHLMVTATACKIEVPFVPELLTADWEKSSGGDPNARQIAFANFQYYANELGANRVPFTVDKKPPLVDGARAYLNNFGGEERIYRTLLDAVSQNVGAAPSLAAYSRNFAKAISVGQEPVGAFTPKGWGLFRDRLQKRNNSASGDSCVLGSGGQQTPLFGSGLLTNKIRNMYIEEYIRNWRAYLRSAHVLPYRTRPDAVEKLSLMQESNNPVLAVLFLVHTNTNFPNDAPSAASTLKDNGAAALKSASAGYLDTLTSRLKGGSAVRDKALSQVGNLAAPSTATPSLSVGDITAAFQPAHSLFGPSAGPGNWIDGSTNGGYMDVVRQMRTAMDNLAHAPSPDTDAAKNDEANKASQNGVGAVLQLSYKFVNPEGTNDTGNFLKEPFTNSDHLIVRDMGEAGKKKLNAAFKQLCMRLQPLLTHFPFSPDASDASLDEVKAMFGPDGAFSLFYRENLTTLLVRGPGKFTPNPSAPPDLKLEPRFVDWMNRMAAVSDALYPASGARYKLNVLPNSLARTITLTIDGEAAIQGTPKQFSWPGSGQGLRMVVVFGGDVSNTIASYNGPWSIYHLVSEADTRNAGDHEITISKIKHGKGNEEVIKVGEASVVIKIQALEQPGDISAAFDKGFFSGLQCPKQATQ